MYLGGRYLQTLYHQTYLLYRMSFLDQQLYLLYQRSPSHHVPLVLVVLLLILYRIGHRGKFHLSPLMHKRKVHLAPMNSRIRPSGFVWELKCKFGK